MVSRLAARSSHTGNACFLRVQARSSHRGRAPGRQLDVRARTRLSAARPTASRPWAPRLSASAKVAARDLMSRLAQASSARSAHALSGPTRPSSAARATLTSLTPVAASDRCTACGPACPARSFAFLASHAQTPPCRSPTYPTVQWTTWMQSSRSALPACSTRSWTTE